MGVDTKDLFRVEAKTLIIYFATPIIIESTVFWRKFSVKRVFAKMECHWETQKKIWEKRVGKGSSGTTKWHKWHKLVQMEQVEQVEAGLQNYVEQVEQEQGGLQIPWYKWNKDKELQDIGISGTHRQITAGFVMAREAGITSFTK